MKSKNVPFYVTASLSTPVILSSGYLMLEGILSAAIFKLTNNVDQAINDIPLDKSGGIFHGSQAYLDIMSGTEFNTTAFVRKMGGSDIEPGAWVPNTNLGKNGYAFSTRKDNYQNRIDYYEHYYGQNIVWFGCGDIDRVRHLLSEITAVGAKRNQGYGSVMDSSGDLSWAVTECYRDCSMMLAGQPARPIPLEYWHTISADHSTTNLVVGMTAISLPAWASSPVLCALPDTRIVKRLSVLIAESAGK